MKKSSFRSSLNVSTARDKSWHLPEFTQGQRHGKQRPGHSMLSNRNLHGHYFFFTVCRNHLLPVKRSCTTTFLFFCVPQRENESALEDSLCRFRDIFCISADSPSDHGSACCASVGSLYPQCCICTRLQGPGQAFYTRGQQTGRFCVTYLSRLYLIYFIILAHSDLFLLH